MGTCLPVTESHLPFRLSYSVFLFKKLENTCLRILEYVIFFTHTSFLSLSLIEIALGSIKAENFFEISSISSIFMVIVRFLPRKLE